MGDERALPARARKAANTSKLPECRPDRMWGGPGSGASCAICGKTIGTEEVEIELQFVSDGSGTANYYVHARCYAAWELERRRGSSNGHSLPQAGNGGIMPGRERNSAIQAQRD